MPPEYTTADVPTTNSVSAVVSGGHRGRPDVIIESFAEPDNVRAKFSMKHCGHSGESPERFETAIGYHTATERAARVPQTAVNFERMFWFPAAAMCGPSTFCVTRVKFLPQRFSISTNA